MSQLVTGVTQKLQDLLPDQIGTNRRWDSTTLERLIMLADRAVRERTETSFRTRRSRWFLERRSTRLTLSSLMLLQ